jgi:hypothetical protein
MSLFNIETKREKELRLKACDLENQISEKEARLKGKPYFGWRYSDDNRRE